MTEEIKTQADKFIVHLRETEEYKYYADQIRNIMNYPDLMREMNEYRNENFRIQNTFEGEELYDKMEELSNRYENLIEDTRVRGFLDSEASLCKMIRDVSTYLIEGLEFQ